MANIMRLNYDGFVDDILSVQRTKKKKRIKMPMGHRVFHVAKNYVIIGRYLSSYIIMEAHGWLSWFCFEIISFTL